LVKRRLYAHIAQKLALLKDSHASEWLSAERKKAPRIELPWGSALNVVVTV
jgi:hypothetical protein